MKSIIPSLLLLTVLSASSATAQISPGDPSPFSFPNCFIRYVYNEAGLRTQRYYYCPPNSLPTFKISGTETGAGNSDSGTIVFSDAPGFTGSLNIPEISILSWYPNPAYNQVTIELSENAAWEVLVTDMQGKAVRRSTGSGKKFPVDLQGMVPGQYMIVLVSAHEKLALPVTKL